MLAVFSHWYSCCQTDKSKASDRRTTWTDGGVNSIILQLDVDWILKTFNNGMMEHMQSSTSILIQYIYICMYIYIHTVFIIHVHQILIKWESDALYQILMDFLRFPWTSSVTQYRLMFDDLGNQFPHAGSCNVPTLACGLVGVTRCYP